MDAKKDERGYPLDEPGAIMRDPDGNEVWVSELHMKGAIARLLKLDPVSVQGQLKGWKLVEDRREKPPTEPAPGPAPALPPPTEPTRVLEVHADPGEVPSGR